MVGARRSTFEGWRGSYIPKWKQNQYRIAFCLDRSKDNTEFLDEKKDGKK